MADFPAADLRGARFDRADLAGAEFFASDLTDAVFKGSYFGQVVMRGVELVDVAISGEIQNVTINGVDIGPFVEAELDKRYPDRVKMRPSDPAGFREAWQILQRLWAQTVDRAGGLPQDLLHASVDGEWSFIETLRHLAFATDSWLNRAILGDPAPWDPLELPWDEMPDTPGVPRDRTARPDLGTALALRLDRMAAVSAYLGALTPEVLDSRTTPVDAPGWPRPRSYPVKECLLILLNEEWNHRLFAERDLAILEGRQ